MKDQAEVCNNNNNCLKSNIQCIEIRVQWTVHLRGDLAFNPRPELSTDQLGTLWIEIILPKTKPVLVCVCYRPLHQNDYYKLFELSISNISLNSEIIILGDMNTNVDKKNKKCSLVYSMHFFKKKCWFITDATRIMPKSSSIIDLIFISEPDKIQQSGVLPVGYSDHMIIFCTRKLCRLKIGEHQSVK